MPWGGLNGAARRGSGAAAVPVTILSGGARCAVESPKRCAQGNFPKSQVRFFMRAKKYIQNLNVGTVNIWEVPGYRIEMSPFGGIKPRLLGGVATPLSRGEVDTELLDAVSQLKPMLVQACMCSLTNFIVASYYVELVHGKGQR